MDFGYSYALAKNKINILSITPLEEGHYAIGFEYQYINKDKSRVWQKNVVTVYCDDPLNLPEKYQLLIEPVRKIRAELEK